MVYKGKKRSASGSLVTDMAVKWQHEGVLHAPIYGSNAVISGGIPISTGDVRETGMAINMTSDPLVLIWLPVWLPNVRSKLHEHSKMLWLDYMGSQLQEWGQDDDHIPFDASKYEQISVEWEVARLVTFSDPKSELSWGFLVVKDTFDSPADLMILPQIKNLDTPIDVDHFLDSPFAAIRGDMLDPDFSNERFKQAILDTLCEDDPEIMEKIVVHVEKVTVEKYVFSHKCCVGDPSNYQIKTCFFQECESNDYPNIKNCDYICQMLEVWAYVYEGNLIAVRSLIYMGVNKISTPAYMGLVLE